MTLEQLAALVAGIGAPVRTQPAVAPGQTEVARVVTEADAEILAQLHNAGPALIACAQVLARINVRRLAGKHTTVVADRKAMEIALRTFAA
ncbi:MAG TPA: hypothetical protein PLX85_00530 [Dehalococcoidia bacterium]|nr:hypothetical protein [Dehalococcoidia bacterium]